MLPSLRNSIRSLPPIHESWAEEPVSSPAEMLALWTPRPLVQKRLKAPARDGTQKQDATGAGWPTVALLEGTDVCKI